WRRNHNGRNSRKAPRRPPVGIRISRPRREDGDDSEEPDRSPNDFSIDEGRMAPRRGHGALSFGRSGSAAGAGRRGRHALGRQDSPSGWGDAERDRLPSASPDGSAAPPLPPAPSSSRPAPPTRP